MSADPLDIGEQIANEAKRASDARKRSLFKAVDLRAVMRTGPGRRVMWRMLEIAQPFQVTLGANSEESAFFNGRRSVGIELIDELRKHCLQEYRLMEDEALTSKPGESPNARS